MTQVATVEKILKDGYVQISVPRKSACGHDCEECAGCGMTGASIYARGTGPGGRARPETEGGGGERHPEHAGRRLAGVSDCRWCCFLLGYFLSAGLTEGWRYAIAVAAVGCCRLLFAIKLYDRLCPTERTTLTYTIVREF